MPRATEDVFDLHAEVCQSLAHPKRLRILAALRGGELSVGQLAKRLQLPTANLSQHLALLRSRGVLRARRQGANVFYLVSNPKIIQAFDLMRAVLEERLAQSRALVERSQGQGPRRD